MYKCILQSGKVQVTPLTVLVGKNESGKTSLLKALHKFNPFMPEPYNIEREWPRSHREERSTDKVVCTAEFRIDTKEVETLRQLTAQEIPFATLEVTRDYAGRFEVLFPEGIAPDKLHPNDIDQILTRLPAVPDSVPQSFQELAQPCVDEANRLAREGRFTDLELLAIESTEKLGAACSPQFQNPGEENLVHNPQYVTEQNFISQFTNNLREAITAFNTGDSIRKKAHDFIIRQLPTFVYMDEYRAFQGTTMLDQLLERLNRKAPTPEDKTILTILNLSGLSLEDLVRRGGEDDREERRYILDDGGGTLTRKIENNWGQLKYEVRLDADGQQFFTFVKGVEDGGLIRLEERSRGFQWFFSFDLLLMHETKGALKGCVILLDEPGLHLHPEGQADLLKRLEEYAKGNTLIYTSHLPFMIDLQAPERIRILTETKDGTVVTEDLSMPQPEGKLTLQAALGISGRMSFLLSERNLIVEGVDDYWLITALSNLMKRSKAEGLPEELMLTAAGGASEVTYIATLITGQELDVVALYDSDKAGDDAKDKFVKRWLSKYKDPKASAISLGAAIGFPEGRKCSIEDLFEESFYLQFVHEVYKPQLDFAGIKEIKLAEGEQLCKRVESFMKQKEINFNKGSVAKKIRSHLNQLENIDKLSEDTRKRAQLLMESIRKAVDKGGVPA
jgi:energy-coupling factor transporter ATP-binding protein EcfA2